MKDSACLGVLKAAHSLVVCVGSGQSERESARTHTHVCNGEAVNLSRELTSRSYEGMSAVEDF